MRTSSLLTVAGLVVGFLNTGMRPQTLAYPLFTGTLWILADRRRHRRRLWVLPAVAIVWSNLHGSFPLLLVLMGLAAIEDLRDHDPVLRSTVTTGIVASAATLANPYGIGAWRYAVGITTNARIVQQIVEWQPTTIRTAAGALFFLSALGVAAILARRWAPTDRILLLWLGAFFLLALPALRGVVWWSFVFPFALAALPREERPGEDRAGDPMMNRLLVGVLVAALLIALPWWRTGTDPASGGPVLVKNAPQDLLRATVDNLPAKARAMVTEPYASWFEFAAPGIPLFVDSRIELFPDRVWTDYLNVMEGRQGWQAILDRWRVEAVVLQPEETELGSRISGDPAWRLAYRDDQGSLYVRT